MCLTFAILSHARDIDQLPHISHQAARSTTGHYHDPDADQCCNSIWHCGPQHGLGPALDRSHISKKMGQCVVG